MVIFAHHEEKQTPRLQVREANGVDRYRREYTIIIPHASREHSSRTTAVNLPTFSMNLGYPQAPTRYASPSVQQTKIYTDSSCTASCTASLVTPPTVALFYNYNPFLLLYVHIKNKGCSQPPRAHHAAEFLASWAGKKVELRSNRKQGTALPTFVIACCKNEELSSK